MAKTRMCWAVAFFVILLCAENQSKLSENKTFGTTETKHVNKVQITSGTGLLFAEELKILIERYVFGICPQSYKMQFSSKARNATAMSCDVDSEHHDLAGRLASLALRAHSASHGECSRLGSALASVLGDLARTAANTQAFNAAAANEANKKRKLSKSQKAKIQAKQRTALAVKKKAAALAAAAASKMAS